MALKTLLIKDFSSGIITHVDSEDAADKAAQHIQNMEVMYKPGKAVSRAVLGGLGQGPATYTSFGGLRVFTVDKERTTESSDQTVYALVSLNPAAVSADNVRLHSLENPAGGTQAWTNRKTITGSSALTSLEVQSVTRQGAVRFFILDNEGTLHGVFLGAFDYGDKRFGATPTDGWVCTDTALPYFDKAHISSVYATHLDNTDLTWGNAKEGHYLGSDGPYGIEDKEDGSNAVLAYRFTYEISGYQEGRPDSTVYIERPTDIDQNSFGDDDPGNQWWRYINEGDRWAVRLMLKIPTIGGNAVDGRVTAVNVYRASTGIAGTGEYRRIARVDAEKGYTIDLAATDFCNQQDTANNRGATEITVLNAAGSACPTDLVNVWNTKAYCYWEGKFYHPSPDNVDPLSSDDWHSPIGWCMSKENKFYIPLKKFGDAPDADDADHGTHETASFMTADRMFQENPTGVLTNMAVSTADVWNGSGNNPVNRYDIVGGSWSSGNPYITFRTAVNQATNLKTELQKLETASGTDTLRVTLSFSSAGGSDEYAGNHHFHHLRLNKTGNGGEAWEATDEDASNTDNTLKVYVASLWSGSGGYGGSNKGLVDKIASANRYCYLMEWTAPHDYQTAEPAASDCSVIIGHPPASTGSDKYTVDKDGTESGLRPLINDHQVNWFGVDVTPHPDAAGSNGQFDYKTKVKISGEDTEYDILLHANWAQKKQDGVALHDTKALLDDTEYPIEARAGEAERDADCYKYQRAHTFFTIAAAGNTPPSGSAPQYSISFAPSEDLGGTDDGLIPVWDFHPETTGFPELYDSIGGISGGEDNWDAVGPYPAFINDRLFLGSPRHTVDGKTERVLDGVAYSSWQSSVTAHDVFDPINMVVAAVGDASEVRGIAELNGRLIIFKDNDVLIAIVDDVNDSYTTTHVVGGGGLLAEQSIVSHGGVIYYLSPDGIRKLSEDGAEIVSEPIRTSDDTANFPGIDDISSTYRAAATAVWDPEIRGPVFLIQTGSQTWEFFLLEGGQAWTRYNYGTSHANHKLYLVQHPTGRPVVALDRSGESAANKLYFYQFGFTGSEWTGGSVTDESSPTKTWRSHRLLEDLPHDSLVRKVYFKGTSDGGTIKLYPEGDTTNFYTFTIPSAVAGEQTLEFWLGSDGVATGSPSAIATSFELEFSSSAATVEISHIGLGYSPMMRTKVSET